VITSGLFWALLLVSVPVYWIVPVHWRLRFLAAVSFGYLSYLHAPSVCLMLGVSVLVHALAPRPGEARRRIALKWLVIGMVFFLAFHKYLPPLLVGLGPMMKIVAPIGVSYFSFKLIHYAVERGRGTFGEHSFSTYLCWVFLFPIFAGGPIERFEHFTRNQSERLDPALLAEGATRIFHGIVKRFLIAECWLEIMPTQDLLEQLPDLSGLDAWKYCVLTFLFAYLDFSALSDIAIGASRLFGLRIMENFHWPILAPSIGDFWKRWHMTLMQWCQTYIYMPIIGLTRKPYVAAYATFLTMGLWHAGTLHWVGWGLYHATGVALYQRWARFRRTRDWPLLNGRAWTVLGIVLTFLYVSGGSAFTSVWGTGSVYDSLRILAKMAWIDLPASET
jgi:alginate O-acetyltransferase complex protein AlgI